jgi:hypothetical protein
MNTNDSRIALARKSLHADLLAGPLSLPKQQPDIEDGRNRKRRRIVKRMIEAMGEAQTNPIKKAGQTKAVFEAMVADFLKNTFLRLRHLRPGRWHIVTNPNKIAQFEQFQHIQHLRDFLKTQPDAEADLGGACIFWPDLVISREPEQDEVLNGADDSIVCRKVAQYSPLRQTNNRHHLIHASISCKWTAWSDPSQTTRTETINLMRNRNCSIGHTIVITAEPLSGPIGSIAYGANDLQCIYHIALPELLSAYADEESDDDLSVLVKNQRLRDISDLPLDLAV